MANTVIAVRSSGATGNQPSLGVIANGELSLNFADGIIYYKTASNTLGQIRTTQVSGSNQQVQFNDSGSFGSNTKFTFDKNTGTLSVPNVSISNISTTGLLTSSYNPSSVQQVSVVSIAGSNTKGGTGYVDFLSANNQSSGATNTNKWFRIDNSGTYQIINSAYTTNIFNLTDAGNLTAPNLTLSGGGGGAITFADGSKQYTANASAGGASVSSVGGASGAISNTQLVSFVTTPTLPTTGNLLIYNGTSFASLANTGTAGTYGNAAYHPVITTDAYGRVSSVTNTAISIPTTAVTGTFGFSSGGTNATSYTTGTLLVSNGTAIVSLANTGTAGTYGNSTYVPVITTDAYGRVTSIVNTAISGTGGSGGTINFYNANTQVFQATANGAQTSFDLGFTPTSQNNVIVTANGITQYAYSLTGSTLTLSFTPPVNTIIRAQAFGLSAINSFSTVFTTGSLIISNGTTLVSLANTGTAGTYGNASYVPVITTDSYGRVSSVTNTVISIPTTSITGLATSATTDTTNAANITSGTLNSGRLPTTGTAGTYGNAAYHPVITTDSYGRVSSVVNTAILIPSTAVTGLANSATIDTTNAANIVTGTISSSLLPTTGTAGTYGNSTYVPIITTDSYGRVTSITNTAITAGGSITSVGGQTGAISNTQLISFVTTPTLPTTGNLIIYNGSSFASLANVGTAGTYGNASYVPVITTDAYGRVTSVVNTAISGGGSVTSVGGQTGAISNTQLVSFVTSSVATGNLIVYNGSNLTSIANVGTAGTYGNSTYIPVITTDSYGRITSVTNTAMTGTQLWSSNSQIYQVTANGAQTSFNLGFSPNTPTNVIVTANGVVQYDYTVTGSTLTFNFTPANNSLIRVQSFGYIQSTIVTVPSFSSNGNLVVSSGSSLVALPNVGSAGSYGSASYIPVITTDAYGRISSVTNTAIALNSSQLPTIGTAGTYGNAAYVPVVTTDTYGRVTTVTNTAISIPSTAVTGTFGFSSGGTNATSYTTGTLLTSNGTAIVSLANTGTAGTYGNAAYHPVITTDSYGRVSSVTNTAISIPTTAVTGVFGFSSGGTNAASYTTGNLIVSNGTSLVSIANTGTAGTYANAAYVPVITTDAYGRVSSVVNTAIAITPNVISGTWTATQTFYQINYLNNPVSVVTNAGTVPITYRLNTFTNSSAAAMTINMATTGAVDGQMSIVRIYDFSAVAQTVTWSNTENSTVTVPTTSNGSTTLPLTVGFMYNTLTSKWRCIASS